MGARDAQLAHAVGQSVDGPHPDDTFVVILATKDEADLRAQADRLERLGVALVRVVECEGPYAGQVTAVGLKPARKEVVRRFVSSLPMLR